MTSARIRLGTSSWTGDGWVGSFYPAASKAQDFLPLYARRFDTVEIDSTFYRIPSARTVEQWRERTPEGFTFAAKVPQTITHEKMLVGVGQDLAAFIRVMGLLGDKLGPLLLQFPYFNKQKFRDLGSFLERLEPFLAGLPKDHKWVVEVRNRGWLSEKLYAVLRKHGVALALVDHAWMPRPAELFETGDPVTASFTFVRWIGDRKGIEEQTKVWNRTLIDRTEDLREWIKILTGVARRVDIMFAYANNHYGGYAPDTIEIFRSLWPQYQDALPGDREKRNAAGSPPGQQLPGFGQGKEAQRK
ncbi:MAG TPA: DUF72 domain-containing protein [Terriglobia bacterium]|nr:DUF72 domain-containing protein [Terriglobia bacterium]